MTPKEKAEYLVSQYMTFDFNTIVYATQKRYAKQCALIAVNEMIDYLISIKITGTLMTYWQEVKNEISNL